VVVVKRKIVERLREPPPAGERPGNPPFPARRGLARPEPAVPKHRLAAASRNKGDRANRLPGTPPRVTCTPGATPLAPGRPAAREREHTSWGTGLLRRERKRQAPRVAGLDHERGADPAVRSPLVVSRLKVPPQSWSSPRSRCGGRQAQHPVDHRVGLLQRNGASMIRHQPAQRHDHPQERPLMRSEKSSSAGLSCSRMESSP
jgi:hypothetical protein